LDSIDAHHYDDTELSKYRAYKIFKEAYPNFVKKKCDQDK